MGLSGAKKRAKGLVSFGCFRGVGGRGNWIWNGQCVLAAQTGRRNCAPTGDGWWGRGSLALFPARCKWPAFWGKVPCVLARTVIYSGGTIHAEDDTIRAPKDVSCAVKWGEGVGIIDRQRTTNVSADRSTLNCRRVPFFFHIGWMRTGSTYLQDLFRHQPEVHFVYKSRFFSHDPLFRRGTDFFYDDVIGELDSKARCIVDSDENYAMGRFKRKLVRFSEPGFTYKAELRVIHHDIVEMIGRLRLAAPQARIIGVIRKQDDWLSSVYKHDVFHYGLDVSFARFLTSELGNAYLRAADYARVFEEYVGAFGSDSVQLLLYEDLKGDPDRFFDEISSFLGLELGMVPEQLLRRNTGIPDVAAAFLWRVNKLSQADPNRPERRIYLHLRRWSMRIARRIGKLVPPADTMSIVSPAQRQYILDRYRAGNRRLGTSLGRGRDMAGYGYF
jgi:hypothetical protein